jgi:hypothetical protein
VSVAGNGGPLLGGLLAVTENILLTQRAVMQQLLSGLLAAIPLAAVLIGAILGYLSGRPLETRKQLTLQEGQAYADYLKALATAATDRKTTVAVGLAADAKTRICIYGSPDVVRALSGFEQAGARVAGERGQAAVAQLVKAMRADMGVSGAQIAEGDLHMVLFGPTKIGA